jgi:hypothetical protein
MWSLIFGSVVVAILAAVVWLWIKANGPDAVP